MSKSKKQYNFWNLILDFFLLWLTAGLWLIWIMIRELIRFGILAANTKR